jgi:hypothetical protein
MHYNTTQNGEIERSANSGAPRLLIKLFAEDWSLPNKRVCGCFSAVYGDCDGGLGGSASYLRDSSDAY